VTVTASGQQIVIRTWRLGDAEALREQHRRTLTLVQNAGRTGRTRVAEMNQQVLANLDKMITEIEKDSESEAADAG